MVTLCSSDISSLALSDIHIDKHWRTGLIHFNFQASNNSGVSQSVTARHSKSTGCGFTTRFQLFRIVIHGGCRMLEVHTYLSENPVPSTFMYLSTYLSIHPSIQSLHPSNSSQQTTGKGARENTSNAPIHSQPNHVQWFRKSHARRFDEFKDSNWQQAPHFPP